MGLSDIQEEIDKVKGIQIRQYDKYFDLIGILSVVELVKWITLQFKVDHHIELTPKDKMDMFVIGTKIERVMHEIR